MESSKEDHYDVFITKEAFRNMITHILRFGHQSLEIQYNVMGICLGSVIDNEVKKVINAIPITHGNNLDMIYSEENIKSIRELETKYENDKISIIGWYHSFPGSSDNEYNTFVKDILNIQNGIFPNLFNIVFKNSKITLSDNFGCKIFPTETTYVNEENTLSFKIEPPKTLDYFKWVQKFVEDFHKQNPILIKEIQEFSDQSPQNLQTIPESNEIADETFFNNYSTDIANGLNRFKENFIDIIQAQVEPWITQISTGVQNKDDMMINLSERMINKSSVGMNQIKSWFKRETTDALQEIKEYISNLLNIRIESNSNILKKMDIEIDATSNNLNSIISNEFNSIHEIVKSEMDNLRSINNENRENIEKILDTLEILQKKISELLTKQNALRNKQKENIIIKLEDFNESLKALNQRYLEKLSNFEEENSKISKKLKQLQKVTINLRNLY